METFIRRLRKSCWSGIWNGKDETAYFRACRHSEWKLGIRCIFTRDAGHHASGWWKNPDYERCLHLSVSFFDPETEQAAPKNQMLTDKLIHDIFGVTKRWLWCEPPWSKPGKERNVWHYRVFCDQGWQPIKPRGEVYNRELTEAGWLSFSDLQASLQAEREGGRILT